ncbi:acyl-CoA dehydrogenase, N-terminal domain protein [Mycobacterium xenopi 4042]|uniref:Acyl-CoA dehydrogenase, N-terminal domain protein n=1 Tax=Mycobacterium xenopi 4042 TaxID=1299334 RepID=X7ZXH6_MYCXE|nr:acyl-CoA dehydrogenase, N-terminal domain protein [Mycobacterium xenopi 4042]
MGGLRGRVLPRRRTGRASANGTSMLAPTLFAHGTQEQLDRVLPKMASGEEIWAQAWSEPEAGSDLASLRSTATRTEGGWLLNGQKIWSSRAPFGDKAFGLFRSDPTAERHRGLTYFMFDLRADGVTVRPIKQLNGDTGFGEIFLDDVFVPDRDVIGEVNDGWRAAMSTSSNERGMSLRSRHVSWPLLSGWFGCGNPAVATISATRLLTRGSRRKPTGCIHSAQ